MKLRLVDSAGEFLDRASTSLEADEPRHNVILGLATTIRDQHELDPELRFWVVEVARIHMSHGVYELERIRQTRPAPSAAPRRASAADRELLVDWYGAFVLEAVGSDSPDLEDVAVNVGRRLEQPALR
jgi:hypothetical protein